jgi:nitric oxide reductase activation protein
LYFETPSINVTEVRVNYFGKPSEGDDRYHHNAWEKYDGDSESTLIAYGVSGNFDPDETVLGPALLKMRRVFADNRRATMQRNIKSGRINAKVLGKRAVVEDPRLFKHHTIPGKKDYSVVLGMDISGSTIGVNISLEKRAVMAQANLLSRMGIDFAIVAHTALGNYTGATLDMYIIKDFRDQWSKDTQEALRKIGPHSGNLDGHALEFMRKLVERTVTTDKVIMYYSDGKMPAMNFEEELEVLQREIRICKQKGIKLLGVGIRTDSPTRHGLDTVEVEEDRDILKVVKHLEKHLT